MERRFVIVLAIAAVELLVFRRNFLVATFGTIALATGYYLADYLFQNEQTLFHDMILRMAKIMYKSRMQKYGDLFESVVEPNEYTVQSVPTFCKICARSPCCLDETDIYEMKRLPRKFRPIKINRVIDAKLTEFLDLTVENYIKDWYSSINDQDQSFVDNLKSHLKFSLSVLAYRVKHVDLTDSIFDRFLPPVTDFLCFYFELEESCNLDGFNLTEDILTKKMYEIYSSDSKFHPALFNRTSEINYLLDISQYLLEKCLNFEIEYTTPVMTILREILAVCILSPVMDILADPETLNFLLETLFSDGAANLSDYELKANDEVELLVNFVSKNVKSTSFLVPNLSDILNNQPLLYIFISFMKRIHGPMNFLQFLLSIYQLKCRLTSQILEPVQKETLDMVRWEIWELYRNYLHNQSNDRICQLDDQVMYTFKRLTENPDLEFPDIKSAVNHVYDYIFLNFDRNYVSGYFATSEEYLQYICGTFNYADNPEDDHSDDNVVDPDSVEVFRRTVKNVLQSRSSMRSCDSPHLSSKSSRRESASDQEFLGASINDDISINAQDKDVESLLDLSSCPNSVFESSATDAANIFAGDICDNILLNAGPDFGAAVKDLSRWTVDIRCVEPRRDSEGGKTMYVYVVSVSRQDVLSLSSSTNFTRTHSNCSERSVEVDIDCESNCGSTQSWKIDRKYHEFYVLEAKLVEFHTESILEEQPLPPKKLFNVKSRAFVESMRPEFDRFLKRLLKSKRLKHSELLYTFLTSTDELTLSFLPNPLLLVKNIPNRFVLERGQNLVSFLDGFQNCSTKNSPLITSKSSSKLLSSDSNSYAVPPNNGQLLQTTPLYQNNFNLSNKFYSRRRKSTNFSVKSTSCSGRCLDVLLLLTRQILQLPYCIYVVIIAALYPYTSTLWSISRHFCRKQINAAVEPPRLAYLIEFLTNKIYKNRVEKVSSSRERTLMIFQRFADCNLPLNSFYREKLVRGFAKLLNCIQHPIMNKHLSYVLLDVALCELFPELSREKVNK